MGVLDFLKPEKNKDNDPFELLKTDHRKVEELFKLLEEDTGQRDELFKQLKSELELHTRIEETIFYPALKRKDETRDITLEAFEEHKGVKTLLAEMDVPSKKDETWDAKLTVLKENVEHHVGEEEGEMFQKARDVLSDEQQKRLGRQMAQEKNKSLMAEQQEAERKMPASTKREQSSLEERDRKRGRAQSNRGRSGRTSGRSDGRGTAKSAARSGASRRKPAQASQPARKRKKDLGSTKRVVARKASTRKKR